MAADLRTSRVFLNDRGRGWIEATDRAVITDKNGMGAAVGDYDNDGWLDLFHTNGWFDYGTDRSKLFMNGGGRFRERAERHGIIDEGSGRAVVCFDYDRDGDTDVLVGNHNDRPRLYRNDGGNSRSFLDVALVDDGPNTAGVGARVYVTANGDTQMREMRCGSNYVSQNPTEAHFGLGDALSARVRIVWPDGEVQRLGRVGANQLLTVERS